MRQVREDISSGKFDSPKKRAHSVEGDEPLEVDVQTTTEPLASRPTRPLRVKSSSVQAPSLPNESFFVSDPHGSREVEEEDWSQGISSETGEQQFEAMEL